MTHFLNECEPKASQEHVRQVSKAARGRILIRRAKEALGND